MMISSNSQNERPLPRNVQQSDLSSGDPYTVLGLQRGATLREIKKGYFALVREYPPESAAEAFKVIRVAYEELRTAGSKAETDLFLFRPPTPLKPRKRRKKLVLDFDSADILHFLEGQSDLSSEDFSADYRPVRL